MERVASDHLQMGKLRHEEMGLCLRVHATSQPLSQATGAEQKWEGFEVMTGMAGKAVMMSLA